MKLMAEILKEGKSKPSRGIHDLKSIFGYQIRFDMRRGFPLLTTKKMPFKILLHELFWFVSGSTNIQYLHDHKIHYWDGFADENLNLGPVYGAQWRRWKSPSGEEIDQLAWAIQARLTQFAPSGEIVFVGSEQDLTDPDFPDRREKLACLADTVGQVANVAE